MKMRIGAGLLVLALAALAAWHWWPSEQEPSTLRITGNVEMTEVQVAFKMAGRIEEIRVREGDPVHAGMLLARLDEEELQQRRQESLAAVQAASSRVQELQAQRAFQQENLEGLIEDRQSALAAQRFALQELLSGTRRQEIEQAEAILKRARSRLQQAESDYKRAQPLVQHEDISPQQFEHIKTAYETAQAEEEQAEQRLDLLREGPRQEDIQAARSRVSQAEAQLRLARAGGLEIERLGRAIEAAQAEVERARAQVAQIESRLEDSRAHSSIEGVVLLKSAEAGEVVAAGSPVLTLGEQARPWMRGYIPEKLLGRVRLGSEVRVMTDSYPGKAYRGKITFIASEAEFTPRQVLTPEQRSRLVYRIKISLDNPQGELKLNMPCDAEIPLQPTGEEGSPAS